MWCRFVLKFAVCFYLACGCVYGEGCRTDAASISTSEITTYECRHADGKITIDGECREKAWNNATPITRFYEIRHPDAGGPQKTPDDQFSVKLLYDDENLYIAATIRDRDIVVNPDSIKKERRKEDLLFLDGDTFEFFIQPDADKPLYYEFHINPLNAIWDARMAARNYMYWKNKSSVWQSGMRSGVKIDGTINQLDEDRGWMVEVAVPLRDLTDADGRPVRIVPGTKWRISFCLYDYQFYYDDCGDGMALKYFSSSMLARINYHDRKKFNFIEFK